MAKTPVTKKYRQEWVSVKGNHDDAEKMLTDLLRQRDQGTYVRPKKITLGAFLDQWLRDYCDANLARNTAQHYRYVVERHLRPTFGSIPLAKLSPEDSQRLYAEKLANGRKDGKGGLNSHSVMHIHITLHRALKSAVKLGMLARNVADAVDPPTVKRREMHTLSEADIHLFLDYARDTGYFVLFYLALFTGLRGSELLALKWSDIDLPLSQLSVVRTIQHLRNGETIFSKPKTVKSRRVVALSPSTVEVLREHYNQGKAQRRPIGENDSVFTRPDGTPLLPDSVTQIWRRIRRRVGLRGIRLHDARHTHSSLMLKQGIHPKIVQERLGHANIATTLDVYSHVAPGLQEAAARGFDDIVIGNHSQG